MAAVVRLVSDKPAAWTTRMIQEMRADLQQIVRNSSTMTDLQFDDRV